MDFNPDVIRRQQTECRTSASVGQWMRERALENGPRSYCATRSSHYPAWSWTIPAVAPFVAVRSPRRLVLKDTGGDNKRLLQCCVFTVSHSPRFAATISREWRAGLFGVDNWSSRGRHREHSPNCCGKEFIHDNEVTDTGLSIRSFRNTDEVSRTSGILAAIFVLPPE